MKTVTTKPEKLKAIYFDEFVDYVKAKAPGPNHWHCHLYGVPVTHENDSHYILMPDNGQVDFRRGQVLLVREDFSMVAVPESDLMHQTRTSKYGFELEVEKPLLESLS